MMTIISIAIWPITIIGYIIFNLFNKNVKLEKIINNQSSFIKNILSLADNIDKTAQKIDSTMWVSADPELKIMFDDIKTMQENIKQFTSKL
jgi:peptidoglycan hydrolase CwlO-like protein